MVKNGKVREIIKVLLMWVVCGILSFGFIYIYDGGQFSSPIYIPLIYWALFGVMLVLKVIFEF